MADASAADIELRDTTASGNMSGPNQGVTSNLVGAIDQQDGDAEPTYTTGPDEAIEF
jgi:hypothetical protein